MAKKKSTIRKKASTTGKNRHDSEVRRAKRAVSAASSSGSSGSEAAEPSPSSASPANEASAGIMKRLLQAAASPFVMEVPAEPSVSAATEKLDLSFSGNPLAELAGRHVRQAGQFPPDMPSSTDSQCNQLLRNLANARIQTALQIPLDRNRPLSDSSASNGY